MYPFYPQALSIRTADKDKLAPCLRKLVPIIQRAQVDFLANPAATNNFVVDLVRRYHDPAWSYSKGLASYATQLIRKDFVGNGPDETLGNFDSTRVQRLIDLATPILRNHHPQPKEGLKPEDIFTNDFINPDIRLS